MQSIKIVGTPPADDLHDNDEFELGNGTVVIA